MIQDTEPYRTDLQAARAAARKPGHQQTPDDKMAIEAGRQIEAGLAFAANLQKVVPIR